MISCIAGAVLLAVGLFLFFDTILDAFYDAVSCFLILLASGIIVIAFILILRGAFS